MQSSLTSLSLLGGQLLANLDVRDLRLDGADWPLVLGFDSLDAYPEHSRFFGMELNAKYMWIPAVMKGFDDLPVHGSGCNCPVLAYILKSLVMGAEYQRRKATFESDAL